MASSGVMLTSIVLLFIDYFSYPVTATINVKAENQLTFPAVTVCNVNQVKNEPEIECKETTNIKLEYA